MRVAIALVLLCVLAGCGSGAKGLPASSAPPKTTRPVTLPGATPPRLHVDHPAAGTAPGYVFLAEKGSKKDPSGVVIADNEGRIVWYHQVPKGLEATDFRTQMLNGKPVLTWWQGVSTGGVGRGEDEIYDASYHFVESVKAADGLDTDLHEFQLTPRGTAYVTAYDEVQRDLRYVGGPENGWVLDSVVQEVDLATGKAVFEWHSLDHVPFAESLQAGSPSAKAAASKKTPLDYFHVNSVADGPGGTILVSGRNTSSLYLLARDGHVVWRLGGRRSSFGPKAAVTFWFQHDARFDPNGTLSLFDNGGIPKLEPHSRALVLKLDVAARRATVVKTFVSPGKIASPYEGDVELLPDGGAFVGWGGVPKLTEFAPDGTVRFQLSLPYGDTYRGYRLPWTGDPGGSPAVAVKNGVVYASWNGKRGIAKWEVLDGSRLIASAARGGLETAIRVANLPGSVTVRAVDAGGRTLGQSTAG